MIKTPFSQHEDDSISALILKIPFFEDIQLRDKPQFDLLLEHSNIVELKPGEVLIKKGNIENSLYFSLSGRMDVFRTSKPQNKAISQLPPGQLIAGISVFNEQPNTATLAACRDYTNTKALELNYDIFGELTDFSQVKLTTKLIFLRLVLNNIRWKLQMYKQQQPDNPLNRKLDNIENFNGEKNTVEELEFMGDQAFLLGQLLDLWNQESVAEIELPDVPDESEPKRSLSQRFTAIFTK